jgi:hypothetical protein
VRQNRLSATWFLAMGGKTGPVVEAGGI